MAPISMSIVLSVMLAPGFAVAQDAAPRERAPDTVVTALELESAVQHMDPAPVADAALRVLSIGDEYNVGISVVRRSQVQGRTPPDAIVHDAITEVYHIIEGHGVLVTGGSLNSPTPLAAEDSVVRRLVGPSAVGKSISGGTLQRVGPGDIVVIPPHTAHGFAAIETQRIVYTVVRFDPHRLLETHAAAH